MAVAKGSARKPGEAKTRAATRRRPRLRRHRVGRGPVTVLRGLRSSPAPGPGWRSQSNRGRGFPDAMRERAWSSSPAGRRRRRRQRTCPLQRVAVPKQCASPPRGPLWGRRTDCANRGARRPRHAVKRPRPAIRKRGTPTGVTAIERLKRLRSLVSAAPRASLATARRSAERRLARRHHPRRRALRRAGWRRAAGRTHRGDGRRSTTRSLRARRSAAIWR